MSDIEPYKSPNDKYSKTFLEIQKYWFDMTGTITISDHNKKILERWSFADSQIRMEWVDEANVPKLLMLKFPDIKRTTAYWDIRMAKKLFKSSPVDDQMYYSDVHYSYALKSFKDALKTGKHGAAARFLKLMHDIKTKNGEGLMEEQMQQLAETLKSSKLVFIVNDATKVGLKEYDAEYIAALEKELSIDKNAKPKSMGEYTSFEEVKSE